jgi:hypothetical protein
MAKEKQPGREPEDHDDIASFIEDLAESLGGHLLGQGEAGGLGFAAIGVPRRRPVKLAADFIAAWADDEHSFLAAAGIDGAAKAGEQPDVAIAFALDPNDVPPKNQAEHQIAIFVASDSGAQAGGLFSIERTIEFIAILQRVVNAASAARA